MLEMLPLQRHKMFHVQDVIRLFSSGGRRVAFEQGHESQFLE